MLSNCTKKLTRSVRSFFLLTAFTAAASMGAQAGTFTVTNINDSGAGSLRQAIADSNNSPEDDTIEFSSLFSTPQRILMKSTLIAAGGKGSLTINGPSQNQLTLRSEPRYTNNFSILPGAAATINNLVITESSDLFVSGGKLTLNNSTVTKGRNRGGIGGGITVYNAGQLMLTNSTLTGNFAGYVGGGIYNNNSAVTVINSTISGNQASSGSSGIYAINGSATVNLINSTIKDAIESELSAKVNTRNSIIVWVGSSNRSFKLNSLGYNIIGNGQFISVTGDTATNLYVDPMLDPVLRLNGGVTATHTLLPNSPAIDAAQAAPGVFTDQRGMMRPIDVASKPNAAGSDSTDIGAVEQQQ